MHIYQKTLLYLYPQSNGKSAISIFPDMFPISMSRTFTNSPYRFNTTDITFNHYHPETLTMKSYQKLSPPSYLVGGAVPSILIIFHKPSTPYNFNIQFPISTKLLKHVEGVTLNTSLHLC